jgi:TPP-dependent pyruvate/acetoin dehydrogenase alpha subunit
MTEAGVLEQIEKDVEKEIAEGVEFALNAPFPKPEEVTEDVFA